MHSLAHHSNQQLQYIQLQQQVSALATPNPLNVGGATNLHGIPMGGDPWGTGAGAPMNLPIQRQQNLDQLEEEKIYSLITGLTNPASREAALAELSKKREQYDNLALILWHSFGVMAALLQEIVSVYPLLSPPALTTQISNRVCNALALFQCVASHNETRGLFLSAHIPLFLYPFLNTTSKARPFEYLRLTSLGVIGALVKNDNPDVISFLLSTEIIPLCLRIMETGNELSKTVAIFIVQKILLDEMGLAYICATYERFYAVGTVLSNMTIQGKLGHNHNRLVFRDSDSDVVRCLGDQFLTTIIDSTNPRAREALRQCLPEPLRDATFSQVLKDDIGTKRCLAALLVNLSDNREIGEPVYRHGCKNAFDSHGFNGNTQNANDDTNLFDRCAIGQDHSQSIYAESPTGPVSRKVTIRNLLCDLAS
ncbi:10734_t:CDS:2 [Acaulospora colombiana]|uniref:10734_t:CDS:1 n=1 Tax=Acaulospora colombiana TaxID=27376 RepID=A0ACA9L279_9GLOM|nr:10734_t:CDS:2 [Acaulospora colombiana]